ncbi:hypothetical protein GGR92_003849 [Spirosoma lacussanchae]|uniref:hypothetical protein n=1 Tax=Spirosoma lacussanchae TaxID=1884249 RepID=UPI0011084996|nr:hypothetical protein [Spirosoma lacussanchae]
MSIKLFSLEVDDFLVQSNQIELSDTVRLLLYQQYPSWFEYLAYDNDAIFLEPTLFYSFSDKSLCELPIEQILFGYLPEDKRPGQFKALIDPYGLISLPSYGYIHTSYSKEIIEINKSDINNFSNKHTLLEESIQLNQHVPFIFYTDKVMKLKVNEPISKTISTHKLHLLKAFEFLQKYSRKFWEIIKLVTREITLFNSPNQRSMAAISYHGTAFINTEGQAHDEVFFIEDLAHQCGHIIFYALTLKANDFLKIRKETPVCDITGVQHDSRTVYGVFHGLFTYTTILYCLTECLKSGVFSYSQQLESIARIGFFMQKFQVDLIYMNHPEIFTPKGWLIYSSAKDSFEQIQQMFKADYALYRYDNQPYIFNYELFREANGILT